VWHQQVEDGNPNPSPATAGQIIANGPPRHNPPGSTTIVISVNSLLIFSR
jgi:hypothetical protein